MIIVSLRFYKRIDINMLSLLFLHMILKLVSGSSPLALEHTWATGTSQFGYLTCL